MLLGQLHKIYELRNKAKSSNAVVIVILKTKLDNTMNSRNRCLQPSDTNRKDGDVACYVRNSFFSICLKISSLNYCFQKQGRVQWALYLSLQTESNF